MLATLQTLGMPHLRRLDPERAHRWAVLALRLGLAGADRRPDPPELAVDALGLRFSNPIGLAAGFDKEAAAVRGLRRLGFGLVEAGTVTPRPQPGNPRPRLFRLEADRAVINRYGLNSGGLPPVVARLARLRRFPRTISVPVGVNVGINKEGADPERDYPALVAAVAPHADYIALNVSSPNTPGLRDLQGEQRLRAILAAIAHAVPHRPKLLIKVAPDLTPGGLEALVHAAIEGGADGLIVGNTTVDRPAGLRGAARNETGGLSGPPLMEKSTALLADAHRLARGRLVLIGCGGVGTGRDVLRKLRAGASLVQLYTAFAYDGPALLPRLKRELREALLADGFGSVQDAIGSGA